MDNARALVGKFGRKPVCAVVEVIKGNKTWSSVSNSSLSQTVALCQFRKRQLQKLCFLPPNVILGMKKMSPKIILGQKKF